MKRKSYREMSDEELAKYMKRKAEQANAECFQPDWRVHRAYEKARKEYERRRNAIERMGKDD